MGKNLLEGDLFHLNCFVEEKLGLLPKLVGALGGEIVHGAAFGALLFDGGMTLEILLCAFGNIFALGYNANATGDVFMDFGQ